MSKNSNVKNKRSDDIAEMLLWNYCDYYDTVFFDIIVEAVENTKKDFSNKENYTLKEVHENIAENYI